MIYALFAIKTAPAVLWRTHIPSITLIVYITYIWILFSGVCIWMYISVFMTHSAEALCLDNQSTWVQYLGVRRFYFTGIHVSANMLWKLGGWCNVSSFIMFLICRSNSSEADSYICFTKEYCYKKNMRLSSHTQLIDWDWVQKDAIEKFIHRYSASNELKKLENYFTIDIFLEQGPLHQRIGDLIHALVKDSSSRGRKFWF